MSNKRIMEVTTVQANAVHKLFESLKEILSDANLIFDSTGISMTAMDSSRVAIAHLRLYSENFEHYYCPQRIQIGLNMLCMYKLIKIVNNNDILHLFIDENNPNELGIRIENSDKNSSTTFHLKLLDIDEDIIQIPDIDFECVITLPSNDLQKICRDMNHISDNSVHIKSIDNRLILSCKGDFANQETILKENTNGLTFSKQNKEVEGTYSLKYLNLFMKSCNLCSTAELFLKNKFPLIIVFNIANLGKVQYGIAPKISE